MERMARLNYINTVYHKVQSEVKWALGSITMNKASGGDQVPVELFQILKDDAVKVLCSICQQIGKLSSGHRTGKGHFSFQSQRKSVAKNAQTTAQLHSSLTHVMFKFSKPGFSNTNSATLNSLSVNCKLPHVQAGFRKGRGTRDQIDNIR